MIFLRRVFDTAVVCAHGVQSAEVLEWLKEACQTVIADDGFEGASAADWAQVLPPTMSLYRLPLYLCTACHPISVLPALLPVS